MVMIQSRFVDNYSGPEFHFWKWIPLLGDSCERIFIWRVEEGILFFFTLFKNIYV